MSMMSSITCPRCAGSGRSMTLPDAPCEVCAGSGEVGNHSLSSHFSFGELVVARVGYDQMPSPAAMGMLFDLCNLLLEPVRAIVGPLRVTSGYRCQALDAAVAGPEWLHKLSGHAIGAAADVVPLALGVTLRDVMEAAEAVPLDQRILEFGCCHLAIYAPHPPGGHLQRREAFVRLPGPTYAVWTGTPEQMTQIA